MALETGESLPESHHVNCLLFLFFIFYWYVFIHIYLDCCIGPSLLCILNGVIVE